MIATYRSRVCRSTLGSRRLGVSQDTGASMPAPIIHPSFSRLHPCCPDDPVWAREESGTKYPASFLLPFTPFQPPRDGGWNTKEQVLHTPMDLKTWVAINYSRVREGEFTDQMRRLVAACNALGMSSILSVFFIFILTQSPGMSEC